MTLRSRKPPPTSSITIDASKHGVLETALDLKDKKCYEFNIWCPLGSWNLYHSNLRWTYIINNVSSLLDLSFFKSAAVGAVI